MNIVIQNLKEQLLELEKSLTDSKDIIERAKSNLIKEDHSHSIAIAHANEKHQNTIQMLNSQITQSSENIKEMIVHKEQIETALSKLG